MEELTDRLCSIGELKFRLICDYYKKFEKLSEEEKEIVEKRLKEELPEYVADFKSISRAENKHKNYLAMVKHKRVQKIISIAEQELRNVYKTIDWPLDYDNLIRFKIRIKETLREKSLYK